MQVFRVGHLSKKNQQQVNRSLSLARAEEDDQAEEAAEHELQTLSYSQ